MISLKNMGCTSGEGKPSSWWRPAFPAWFLFTVCCYYCSPPHGVSVDTWSSTLSSLMDLHLPRTSPSEMWSQGPQCWHSHQPVTHLSVHSVTLKSPQALFQHLRSSCLHNTESIFTWLETVVPFEYSKRKGFWMSFFSQCTYLP